MPVFIITKKYFELDNRAFEVDNKLPKEKTHWKL